MNTPGNETDDELTRAYRQSSDAEAGAPSPAIRAAILAEARAAALRRKPAANDSRYVWRAAAGIAVLGVAVILWRQVDHRLAPDLASASVEPQGSSPVDATRADTNVVTADSVANLPPRDQAAAETASKDERQVELKTAPSRVREEGAGKAAAAPGAGQSVQLARASADAVAPVQAAGAVRKDSPDYQQILQSEFPQVWNGSEPVSTVWVVIDARGNVLRKGELAPGASISADQPFEVRNPWEMVNVKTASGSPLQLAVTRVN